MSFGSTNAGMTGIQFQNTSVTFSLQSTPDFADYPYRGQFANSGITVQAYAEVVYSSTQASSGDYAPFCQTYDGGVYLYARENVGTQTIPTIAVGTASFSLTIDNNVTQGSQNPVSSGGVYNAVTPFGLPIDTIISLGTTAINKCICAYETGYIAQVDGYIYAGGGDPYKGDGYVRIGTDSTHYFQFPFYYSDINSNTKGSCIFIPVRKGQWFYGKGLENVTTTDNPQFNGFLIGSTRYTVGTAYYYWFIPARADDCSASAYRTTA